MFLLINPDSTFELVEDPTTEEITKNIRIRRVLSLNHLESGAMLVVDANATPASPINEVASQLVYPSCVRGKALIYADKLARDLWEGYLHNAGECNV